MGMVSQLKSTLVFKTLSDEMLLKAGVVLHGIIHSMRQQCYRDKLREVKTSGWRWCLALSVSAEEKQQRALREGDRGGAGAGPRADGADPSAKSHGLDTCFTAWPLADTLPP